FKGACRSSCPAAVARPSIYAAKRFSCGPGAERRDPTKQVYIKMFFYDPVVLVRSRRVAGRILASGSRPACVAGVSLLPRLLRFLWATVGVGIFNGAGVGCILTRLFR